MTQIRDRLANLEKSKLICETKKLLLNLFDDFLKVIRLVRRIFGRNRLKIDFSKRPSTRSKSKSLKVHFQEADEGNASF